jgi:hypothetical protein
LRSYCGVASSVTVLNSLGRSLDQSTFFDVDSADHADAISLDGFREIVRDNLQEPDNFVLVNYQREVLGQRRVGHISPIAAYDEESDLVLILDAAS